MVQNDCEQFKSESKTTIMEFHGQFCSHASSLSSELSHFLFVTPVTTVIAASNGPFEMVTHNLEVRWGTVGVAWRVRCGITGVAFRDIGSGHSGVVLLGWHI